MIRYALGEIAGLAGGRVIGDPSAKISQVCTDTRRIERAGESLFIALKGPSRDGHRYLYEAREAGIRSFLVDHLPEDLTPFGESAFVLVPDTLDALQDLAAFHRSRFNGKLIAVTGSNGKTIIKEWLAQLLQAKGRVARSPKSFNSQIGVPLSLLTINGDEDYAIIEAGISSPGEMLKLQRIIRPDFGIFSNIGDAHQENFPSLETKTEEKVSLFKDCVKIYYCLDHDLIHQAISHSGFTGSTVAWSGRSDADLRITGKEIKGSACRLTAMFRNRQISLTLPWSDDASVENLLHIWLFLLDIGFANDFIQKGVNQLEPVRMRLEQKAGINGCALINDYYNSDVQSLRIALDLLIQQTTQPKKTVILSDILQSGLPDEQLYAEINRMISPRGIQRIIGIGPALCRNRNAFIPPIETFASTDEFLARLDTRTFHDEAILLKGARSFAFERISIMLEAKVHATKLEINMNDVRSNLEQYRRIVGPQVRIMAMVKAFSYGSGGVEMARFLANERIDYLGVAFVDEGIEIRRSGIRIPVMVMNADFQQSDLIIDHHLEPEIYNWSGLTTFTHAVGEQDIHPYPVHLKIDTGMHRLGFSHLEARALVRYLDAHPGIYVKSVFSHLAASDDPASDDFTHLQITRFTEACDHLASKLNYPFLRHILNSSGIERFQQARFDMVRLGIGLYGISSTGFQGLKPIATLRTVISQIHDLDAGESVGYGRLTLLDKPSRIGIVPVGYADGIDRRLGNGNYHMRVNGKPVPTIGNICMDMTLLDLNGMDVREGDEVIVFGPDNPVTEMSTLLDTIPYEILTSISPRVKRIYQFD